MEATSRLESHPCVVTVEEMSAARHFVRTQSHQVPEDRRYMLLQPQFEINPRYYVYKYFVYVDVDLMGLLQASYYQKVA